MAFPRPAGIPFPSLSRAALLGALASLAALSALPGRAAAPDAERERRGARAIAEALEAGHVTDAVAKAKDVVREAPESALLQRRLAQAQLCRAIELDNQTGEAFAQAAVSQTITWITNNLRTRTPTPNEHPDLAGKLLQLQGVLDSQQAQEMREEGSKALARAMPLLGERVEAWNGCRAALAEAARLGDSGTEARLTGLWASVVAVAWQLERKELVSPSVADSRSLTPEAERELTRSLDSLATVTADTALREAALLAKELPDDPAALAGAADVLCTLGLLSAKENPLKKYSDALLGGRYLKDRKSYVMQLWPNAREAGRQQYREVLAEREPDLSIAHYSLSTRLYERALELDAAWKVPLLRERVYLLRAPVDDARATTLLDELGKREPQNAFVPLERARRLLQLEEKFTEGLTQLRRAATLPRFARSYLTAVPEPLRLALKYHRGLRDKTGNGWPDYLGLLTTIEDTKRALGYSPQATELLLVVQKLGALLTQSGDYIDQKTGIDAVGRALAGLGSPKNPLPDVIRAEVPKWKELQRAQAAALPRQQGLVSVTVEKGILLGPGHEAKGMVMWLMPGRNDGFIILHNE